MPLQSVTPALLQSFPLFSSMDEHHLLLVSNKVQLVTLESGESLFQAGDNDPWEYFLVEGELSLTSEDGQSLLLEAGSPNAERPVSRLRPRRYSCVANKASRLLKVGMSLLEQLQEEQHQAPALDGYYGVVEVDDTSSLEAVSLMDDFREALHSNQFVLPSLPEVALQVRRLLDDDDVTAATLASAINADPAIAAKLVRAANSPMYRGSKACEATQDAVVRLGLNATRQLVMSFVLRDLFSAEEPLIKQLMLEVWQNSIEVAAISFVVAKMVRSAQSATKADSMPVKLLDPEEALLAGLIHNVGQLAALAFVQQGREDLLSQQMRLPTLIHSVGAEVGELLLRHWRFPEELLDVVVNACNWQRQHSGAADYCDIVQVSKIHSHIWAKTDTPTERLDQLPALGRLPLGQAIPELTMDILAQSRSQISQVMAVIKG